jgi:uncharacterized protein (TIGR00251 family)
MTTFDAHVKPNSPKFSIEAGDRIIINCKSKPEGNKANTEIVRELEKLFKREVKIIKGLKSKKKVILIDGISESQFREMVA